MSAMKCQSVNQSLNISIYLSINLFIYVEELTTCLSAVHNHKVECTKTIMQYMNIWHDSTLQKNKNTQKIVRWNSVIITSDNLRQWFKQPCPTVRIKNDNISDDNNCRCSMTFEPMNSNRMRQVLYAAAMQLVQHAAQFAQRLYNAPCQLEDSCTNFGHQTATSHGMNCLHNRQTVDSFKAALKTFLFTSYIG